MKISEDYNQIMANPHCIEQIKENLAEFNSIKTTQLLEKINSPRAYQYQSEDYNKLRKMLRIGVLKIPGYYAERAQQLADKILESQPARQDLFLAHKASNYTHLSNTDRIIPRLRHACVTAKLIPNNNTDERLDALMHYSKSLKVCVYRKVMAQIDNPETNKEEPPMNDEIQCEQAEPHKPFETKIFIYGRDITQMSESEKIVALSTINGEIENMKSVDGHGSKRIKQIIRELETQRDEIVKIIDEAVVEE